jgi:hypothetical protein
LTEEYRSLRLYLNHCTGDGALSLLRHASLEQTIPCPAGTSMEF